MSGKPYTLKEMKGIVDYLVENKYYSTLKGRKMWMDYANTSKTTRTWQSLKETFIKRILPDIYNPYYKLTKDQIVSFKQGFDVQKQKKNKLEIQSISDDTSSDAGQQQENTEPTKSDTNIQEEPADMVNVCSKISNQNRSSTDTLVLENCYENAEEIQKLLESPNSPSPTANPQKRPIRKFNDFITYSEPLAPILQEVINDFASDSDGSDREPVMEIDLNALDIRDEENKIQKSQPTENQVNTEDVLFSDTNTPDIMAIDVAIEATLDKNSNNNDLPIENIVLEDSKSDDIEQRKPVDGKTLEELSKDRDCTNINNSDNDHRSNMSADLNTESGNQDVRERINKKNVSQNCSNTIDSLLPNNPEGFEMIEVVARMENINNAEKCLNLENTRDKSKKISSRKRAISEDNILLDDKKKKLKTKKEIKNNKDITKKSLVRVVEDVEEVNLDVIKPINNIPILSPAKLLKTTNNDDTVNSPKKENNNIKSSQMENLCLKSVSLHEEQLNDTQYNIDSESSGVHSISKKANSQLETQKIYDHIVNQDVILLKSNTESENDELLPQENQTSCISPIVNTQRGEALANVFGFSTGAVKLNRLRNRNNKRRLTHHQTQTVIDTDSSEWTSQTESEEYILPPGRKRQRHEKKYLKPNSFRVHSLGEEGGLFVMYNKKIYPLVKDGNLVKNYLTYSPTNDSDMEGNDYWKLKYEKEKSKSEKLKKLLNQTQEKTVPADTSFLIPDIDSCCKKTTHHQKQVAAPAMENHAVKVTNEATNESSVQEKVKIKFTRNNDEVHLEGNWPHIHPLLEQVVNIFHKGSKTKMEAPLLPIKPHELSIPKELISSGISTPVIMTADPEVRKRVETIEKEIFREIEERDKVDDAISDKQEKIVTKGRSPQSRKSSSPLIQSSAKALKTRKQRSAAKLDDSETAENGTKKLENAKNVLKTRKTRSKNKVASSQLAVNTSKQTRKMSHPKKEEDTIEDDDDDKVRYMLPRATRGSLNKAINNKNVQKANGSYLTKLADITSPDSLSRISESTQGYHESDISLIQLKKKKKLSTIVRPRKRRSSQAVSTSRRDRVSSSASSRSKRYNNTKQSLSAIYNSESYQYLFPNRGKPTKLLEQIGEICTIEHNIRRRRFEAPPNEEHNINTKIDYNCVGSSSNITLPLSPELSLVENISISKDLLSSNISQQSISKMHTSEDQHNSQVKYVISQMDITLPLMQQTCAMNSDIVDGSSIKNNKTVITESLLNEIRSVKIYDKSSDSIDRRFQNLLLESTKKAKTAQTKPGTDTKSKIQKSNPKKRSSTPRKKRAPTKSKVSEANVVVEENNDTCFHVGGSSCPPAIQIFDENAMDYEEIIPNNKSNVKRKQKKNIIKVKILKPKPNKSKDNTDTLLQSDDRMSLCTDCGITDTDRAIFPQGLDNSVELIHNHSETCLHANECIGDSVELIENNNSVISLNSNSDNWQQFVENEFRRIENNLQHVNNSVQNPQVSKSKCNTNAGEIIYRNPTNGEDNSSIITEDLSDETPTQANLRRQSSKWFLLSEDEFSNTNMLRPEVMGAGSGSNLNQIFPVTCAIPDLSDITEASKDNDDARKLNLDIDLLSAFNI